MVRRNGGTTIKQIAEQLGIHPSTVSRALNPSTRRLIGKDTIARIESSAKEMGYYPNPAAASLRTGRSKLIGVFLPDISNPVFSPILRGIAEVAANSGFATIVTDVGQESQGQIRMMFELLVRRVEGLLLATASRNDNLVQHCLDEGLPVVLVNRAENLMRTSSVTSDDAHGMRLAVEHLHELGHRHIGHIAGPKRLSTGYLRLKGFLEAAEALGLDPLDTPVEEAEAYSRPAGAAATRALLTREPRLTAIVASNDLVALGAYDALRELGMSVPGRISVVGHNDMPLVDMVHPPLTTIRISHLELGREATRLLLSEISDATCARRSVVMAPELIVRGSTRRLE